MDNAILKKRLNTFKSGKGSLTGVADDLVMDVLKAWEGWPGKSKALCQSLGVNSKQLVHLIKKGKNLVKSGAVIERDFKEVKVASSESGDSGDCIVLKWEPDKAIRFKQVDQLVEFLKKVAA